MRAVGRFGWHLDGVIAGYTSRDPPEADGLPWWLAPLPTWIENISLRLAWPIAAINLLGTGFGIWYYYRIQFPTTPWFLWMLVAASPLATLFMALSLASWRLGLDIEPIHMFAFFGNVQFGLWTPFVQLALQSPSGTANWLYTFLVTSHLLMFAQAFLIHRYAAFAPGAIALATVWYALNLVTGYVVPIGGTYTHSRLRAEKIDGVVHHSLPAHDYAAAAALGFTLLCVALAVGTRIMKTRSGTARR